jgi:hypothetical protein
MFLAGENSKGGIKRGSKGEGLPGSFAARRRACLDKAVARKDRRTDDQGASRRYRKEGNKIDKVDIQTAVHDRERYMLYNRQKSSL